MFKEIKKLKLGTIVNGKNGKKELKGQEWNVHWQLNIVLAVFIRDSLKIFLKKTLALPKTANHVLDGLFDKVKNRFISSEEYEKQNDALCDERFNKWKNDLQNVIGSFNKYLELNDKFWNHNSSCSDEASKQCYSDFVSQGKIAFNMLAEIFDDLEY